MKKMISKMIERLNPWVCLALLVGFLAGGCQTPDSSIKFTPVSEDEITRSANVEGVAVPVTGLTNSSPIEVNVDRFVIGDLVKVTFSGTIEPIQAHEERIKDDGTITLPHIGAIKADGKTPGELQKAITDAYVPDYYKRLTVTVSSDRRVYYVGGQVRSPGRQEYLGTTTVTKAIQSAGDFTDFADRRKVLLTRADGKKFTVNCIKAAKDPALDMAVFPGDKLEVPMRGIF